MKPTNAQLQIDDHQQQQQNAKKKKKSNTLNPSSSSPSPSCLKINKDSQAIKKSTPHPSTSSPHPQPLPQQRRYQPVIIYTQSPTVIQTTRKDFMSLVQKLTGMRSKKEDDHRHCQGEGGGSSPLPPPPQLQQVKSKTKNYEENNNNCNINNNGGGGGGGVGDIGIISDDNDSTLTTDHDCNNGGFSDFQVNSSCITPQMFDHPTNPCFYGNNGIPIFDSNSADFWGSSSQPIYDYSDPLFYDMPNMRTSYPSSSSLEGMKGFPNF